MNRHSNEHEVKYVSLCQYHINLIHIFNPLVIIEFEGENEQKHAAAATDLRTGGLSPFEKQRTSQVQ